MFKEVSTKLHFPKIEEEILEFWQAEDIFQKSVKLLAKLESERYNIQ